MSKQYAVILADPAWSFVTYSKERRTPTQKKFRGEATDHYETMSLDEMRALPVSEWAAKDCALIMWVVGSHLPDAIELGRSWGFTYKTDLFWWLKSKLINADQIGLFTGDVADPKISMGYYTLASRVKWLSCSREASPSGFPRAFVKSSAKHRESIAESPTANMSGSRRCSPVLIWKCSLASNALAGACGVIKLTNSRPQHDRHSIPGRLLRQSHTAIIRA